MTKVDCLFDTNAVVKRYHGEPGTKIVEYLFEKSRRIRINLLNIQVAEVIKTFYKLRSDNRIKSDSDRDVAIHSFLNDIDTGDGTKKIKVYDFANEHLKDMAVYGPITNMPTKYADVWNPQTKTREKKPKARPNTVDTIMLIVMREIKFLNEGYSLESYLVTSDEYMVDAAQSFGISIIDPENVTVATLPFSLDMREYRRRKASLRAIFKDTSTSQSLGSTGTVDISELGIKVRTLQGLTQGRVVNCRLESCKGESITHDVWGEVQWQSPSHCGLRLAEPISAEHLEAMAR